MADIMLKVDNINVYYGSIHAIKDISFEVCRGQIVTLIGANGAGKSTTLQTVSGLLHSKTGSIEFLGKSLAGVAPHRIVEHGLAHVPEGRRVFLQMSVEENLEMGAYTRPRSEISDSIADVYSRFPRLKERRKQIAGTLSGGEQQMLAIARALLLHPKMLLLDEPSLGLAPLIVKEIFEAIKRVNAEGMTILFVEQNSKIALETASRGYVLQTGEIVLGDTAENLLNNEEVKKAYLGGN
ncbi:MAG: ABC transporter ATP-binding protein [Eubacteriales bacterium]|nr:ABC transporter ATP-binding protein [Eubacteriales bacterium]